MPAQSTDIIRAGQFTGYMTSRETAHAIGQARSNGCMRADGWARLPLIRMNNVSLLPGRQSLDEVFAGDGIYMETNRSWSIDDKRYNFQFGCEDVYKRQLYPSIFTFTMFPEALVPCPPVEGLTNWTCIVAAAAVGVRKPNAWVLTTALMESSWHGPVGF